MCPTICPILFYRVHIFSFTALLPIYRSSLLFTQYITPPFIAPFIASYATERAFSIARYYSTPFFVAPSLPSDAIALLSVIASIGVMCSDAYKMAFSSRFAGILWPVCWTMGGVVWLAVVGIVVCGYGWVRWPSLGFTAGLILPVLRSWGRYGVVAYFMVSGIELPSDPLFLLYFACFVSVGANCAGIIWVDGVTPNGVRVYWCAGFIVFTTCGIPAHGGPADRSLAFVSMWELFVAKGVAHFVMLTQAGVRVFKYVGCTVVA